MSVPKSNQPDTLSASQRAAFTDSLGVIPAIWKSGGENNSCMHHAATVTLNLLVRKTVPFTSLRAADMEPLVEMRSRMGKLPPPENDHPHLPLLANAMVLTTIPNGTQTFLFHSYISNFLSLLCPTSN